MLKSSFEHVIAITEGDPEGIGPEIIAKAMGEVQCRPAIRYCIIGEPDVLQQACRRYGRGPLPVAGSREEAVHAPYPVILWTPPLNSTALAEVSEATWIRAAAEGCMSGDFSAMVTAPICKESMYRRGYRFPGHTEYLAALTGSPYPVMMFAAPSLRVSLVTIHERLVDVPEKATALRILKTLRITRGGLREFFGIASPRIGLCGLNPHAGEGGHLGLEETERIGPAVAQARGEGIDVHGPYPADTLFVRAAKGEFDVVVAQYHDQGLIPVKLAAFGQSVNVTLGLPIVRTSVDHGVAFDIAGQGVADPRSLLSAISLAVEIANHRARSRS